MHTIESKWRFDAGATNHPFLTLHKAIYKFELTAQHTNVVAMCIAYIHSYADTQHICNMHIRGYVELS